MAFLRALVFQKQSLVFSVPYESILNLSKFKAFAEDKINLTEKCSFFPGKAEHAVGENACKPQSVQRNLGSDLHGLLKVEIV